MAILKTSSATVVRPQVDPQFWIGRTANPRKKVASEVLSAYDSSKWLLSHVSIMASVDVEQDNALDPKKNWRIIPEHSQFVNNNGDSWERSLLARTYGTFLGANNYVEHNQVVALAKGKVIDVALREVNLGTRANGQPLTTLYVDILIATSWEHDDLCNKILSGEFNAVSMGCSCKYTICSRCGNVAHDESELCEHVRFFRRQMYYDNDGVQRIISELCGSADDPSSVTFVDASWVRNPAFPGAVLRNIINPPTPPAGLTPPQATPFKPVVVKQPQPAAPPPSLESLFYGTPGGNNSVLSVVSPKQSHSAPSPANDPLLKSLASRVTTGTKHHEALLKAAADLSLLDSYSRTVTAADPTPDDRFSIGGEDKPEGDAADPAATGAAPAGGGLDDLLSGGAPADPAAPPADPAAPADPSAPAGGQPPSQEAVDTPLDDVKDQVRDSILNQIKQDLLTGAKGMRGESPDTYDDGDDSANLMKYAEAATSIRNARELRIKKAMDVKVLPNKKLAAMLLLMNVSPLEKLASFGYNGSDLIAVLQYIDSVGGKPAVGNDAVRYLHNLARRPKQSSLVKSASEQDVKVRFFRDFIILAGRKPGKDEAERMWSWHKLASSLALQAQKK